MREATTAIHRTEVSFTCKPSAMKEALSHCIVLVRVVIASLFKYPFQIILYICI